MNGFFFKECKPMQIYSNEYISNEIKSKLREKINRKYYA